MQLRIDGQLRAEWNVSSTTTDYRYNIDLCSGNHKVDIVFINDCYAGSVDRNLYIHFLEVGGKTYYPTDSNVTYDMGVGRLAFDGLDVVAGRNLMNVSGALRFSINNGGSQQNCVTEGNYMVVSPGATSCCAGLTPISNSVFENNACTTAVGTSVCAKCGNGVCGAGENECNCEIDCSDDCLLDGDYPLCGDITMFEVISIIDRWSNNQADIAEVIALINAYRAQ